MFRNTGANAFAKNQTRLAYADKRDLYCIDIKIYLTGVTLIDQDIRIFNWQKSLQFCLLVTKVNQIIILYYNREHGAIGVREQYFNKHAMCKISFFLCDICEIADDVLWVICCFHHFHHTIYPLLLVHMYIYICERL